MMFRTLIEDGALVVSCQAASGTPLRDVSVMTALARAAEAGGAAAIRANGVEDVAAIAAAVTIPIIGINKADDRSAVYITPSVQHALAVAEAGAGVVAVDGTLRPRPDGSSLADQIAGIRAASDVLVMADVDCLEAGIAAAEAGADAVATTLSGYTDRSRRQTAGPDVDLVAALASVLDCPVVAEGRIRTDDDVVAVRRAGAHAIVIGTAITNATAITSAYRVALDGAVRVGTA